MRDGFLAPHLKGAIHIWTPCRWTALSVHLAGREDLTPAATVAEESEFYITQETKLAISWEIMFLDMIVQTDHEKLLFAEKAQIWNLGPNWHSYFIYMCVYIYTHTRIYIFPICSPALYNSCSNICRQNKWLRGLCFPTCVIFLWLYRHEKLRIFCLILGLHVLI